MLEGLGLGAEMQSCRHVDLNFVDCTVFQQQKAFE